MAAADTKLNLTLLGVAVGNADETSAAVIGINGKSEVTYRPGQPLPVHGHVTLTRVLHDRVLLDHDGNTEQPLLYRFASNQDSASGYAPGPTVPAAALAPAFDASAILSRRDGQPRRIRADLQVRLLNLEATRLAREYSCEHALKE